jgi:hypothetical protein
MPRDLIALFNPSPPTLPADLRDLFCNRDRELNWALTCLQNAHSDRVYAIHGTRRSGKSHFARRLLQRVEEEKLPYREIVVNAHNLGSARGVLREVYFRFEEILLEFEPSLDAHKRVREEFLHAHRLVNLDQVEWVDEEARRLNTGGEQGSTLALGAPSVGSFSTGVKATAQLEDARRRSEKHVGLSDRDVVRQLSFAADMLYANGAGRRVLLLLDDLDLVDREGAEDSTASDELLALLRPLAARPSVVVVATVRNAFTDGRKNVLEDMVELLPMRPELLHDVYGCRLKTFHEGKEVYDRAALKTLIDSAQGMVGVFLRNCYEVLRFAGIDARLPLTPDAIDRYARAKVDSWRMDPSHVAAVVATEEAARKNVAEIVLSDDLLKSALHLSLLTPVAGVPNTWAINPLFVGAFRPPKGKSK